jgi:hypothetical protein
MRALVGGALLYVIASGAACGGGSSSATADACNKACAKCGADPCANCSISAARYNPPYASSLFSCVTAADQCSATTWETCATQAAAGVAVRPGDDAYRTDCLDKKSSCDAQNEGFADDFCLGSQFLSDAYLAMAHACLANPCAATKTCLDSLFK